MSLHTDGLEYGSEPPAGQVAPELSLTVVRYSDGPNRCTISPSTVTGDARLTTWISVNQSVVVDLAEMR